jgi:hypothetical protein
MNASNMIEKRSTPAKIFNHVGAILWRLIRSSSFMTVIEAGIVASLKIVGAKIVQVTRAEMPVPSVSLGSE